MIIETSDNRFYRVEETGSPDLAHCWYGIELKRNKLRDLIPRYPDTHRNHGKPELVRKAAARVVQP